jgi:hypothetical protein|nr:MAG TPA: hypothetical protein [Caudoviricetes sp.]
MSAETERALEEALSAHLADEKPGDVLGSWLLLAHVDSMDYAEREVSAYEAFMKGNAFTMVGICDAWKCKALMGSGRDS